MTFEKILTHANLHVGAGISITTTNGMRFINEGIYDLATRYKTARKRATIAQSFVAYEWTNLPAGCLTIIGCTCNGFKYDDFEASYDQIQFPGNCTVTLEYLRAPELVATAGDEPDINALYHYPLALFMAARERQKMFGDEESDSVRLMNEYLTKTNEVHITLNSTKGLRKTMRVPAMI